MTNTTYTNRQGPVIDADWLNDVNFVIYDLLGNSTDVPATRTELLANLGAGVVGGGNVSYQQESTPLTPAIGDLWQQPSTGIMQRWDGTNWVPFSDLAQALANTAISNAASAQAAAAAAQAAANTANSAAAAAQSDATSALLQLTSIASDNLLSQVEKPGVILDYTRVTQEQPDIDAKAVIYGITTQKTNYDTALNSLTTYLNTLNTPVAWNNLSGNTTIVGPTFRTFWATVYSARQFLLNEIARVAGTVATWAGISGIDVVTTQLHPGAATDIQFDTIDFAGGAFTNVTARTISITPVVDCFVEFTATCGAQNINGDSGSHLTWYVTPFGGPKTMLGDAQSSSNSRQTFSAVNAFAATGGVNLLFTLECLKGGFSSVNLYLSVMRFTFIKR